MDVWSVVALAVAATLAVVLFFADRIPHAENAMAKWFSSLTQRPRWFVLWWLILAIWLVARHLLLAHHVSWYSQDTDNVSAILLWGVMPYMVENALKFTSAQQMELLLQLVQQISDATDLAKDRDEQIIDLLQKQAEREEQNEARDQTVITLLERIEIALKGNE